jgi:hypothetical protein
VALEWGPLSLVSKIEELLGRNSSGSGIENWEYGRGDPLRWPCDTLYPQKLALTSPTCGGRSVGIVHLRTKTTEFAFCLLFSHSGLSFFTYSVYILKQFLAVSLSYCKGDQPIPKRLITQATHCRKMTIHARSEFRTRDTIVQVV